MRVRAEVTMSKKEQYAIMHIRNIKMLTAIAVMPNPPSGNPVSVLREPLVDLRKEVMIDTTNCDWKILPGFCCDGEKYPS